MKPLFRRIVARQLERSVVRLIQANPELKLVAVGGSIGKTSTKQAIATVLKQKYAVLYHEGNYNTDFGLPLSLFNLDLPVKTNDPRVWLTLLRKIRHKLAQPYPYEVVVLELGTDRPGDIPHFMSYLKPDIGIVTAIAPEHMENFADLAAVADEEFALNLGSKMVVLHANDRNLVDRREQLGDKPVTTYGESGAVHWAGRNSLCLGDKVAQTITVKPQVLGDHAELALLAAAAVAVQLGLLPEQIRTGLNEVVSVPGRMQRLEGKNEVVIIDDTYNASPEAVYAALKTLRQMAKSRRIALLGQMNELGDYSERSHRRVGEQSADLDLLLTLGKDANTILGPAAVKAGLDESKWHAFSSPYEAGEWLAKAAKKGDTILFKGSQNGVFSEEAIKPLLANSDDETKLVRQNSAWLAKKRAQFKVE